MKIRHSTSSGQDKIELQMTPMIDIVFQLLVFFIMTFKIVSQEGDFNIKMPLAAPSQGAVDENLVPPLKIRLRADAEGGLAGITLNDQPFGNDWRKLHEYVISYIGPDRGPGSLQSTTEVELDCDYDLQYSHVVSAITSVSGYIDSNDNIVKLVEKIKFANPRPPAGG
ncbi:MAG: biopolymer transporter ExbD [Planctomycetales bacterium]|nr:biopolymer transporter ExbD [Planctomycetales bacterium]